MEFALSRFEQTFSEALLKKGLVYFQQDQVVSHELEFNGKHIFEVEGNEVYEVRMTVTGDQVQVCHCTCPHFYSNGDLCKHIAACCFFLQHEHLDGDPTLLAPKNKSKAVSSSNYESDVVKLGSKAPAKTKQTIAGKLDRLLDQMAPSELKRIIRETALRDKVFRNELFTAAAFLSGDTSMSFFRKQLQALMKSVKGNGRKDEWFFAGHLASALNGYFKQAEHLEKSEAPEVAVNMYIAVLAELMPVFSYSDDSSGALQDCWQRALEGAENMASDDQPEIRLHLFDYCVSDFHNGLDFDFGFKLLELATELTDSEDSDLKIRCVIQAERKKAEAENNHHGRHVVDNMIFLEHRLNLRTKEPEIVWEFARSNISTCPIREWILQELQGQGKWTEVLSVAQEGYRTDLKARYGLAGKWLNWCMAAQEAIGDLAGLEENRILRFLRGRIDRSKWVLLRRETDPAEWPIVRQRLLDSMQSIKHIHQADWLGIYVEEGMEKEFVSLIKKTDLDWILPSFRKEINLWAPEMLKNYYLTFVTWFSQTKQITDTKNFKKALDYMSELASLVSKVEFKALAMQLEQTHARKKAYSELMKPALDRIIASWQG